MTPIARTGLRLLAAAVAAVLPVTFALADAPASKLHPWKAAYVRRLAEEGLERGESRERSLEQSFREWKFEQRLRAKSPGKRARPAAPELSTEGGIASAAPHRLPNRFATTTFTTPPNVVVNNRLTDVSTFSTQSEPSVAAFGDVVVAAWNDGENLGGNTFAEGWATSGDGGATWIDRGQLPPPAGVANFLWVSDPVFGVNEKTGAFYFSALCEFGPGRDSAGVAVVKGRWNGTTIAWNNPAITHRTQLDLSGSNLSDKNWIVADSSSGRVYLSYTQFTNGLSRIVFQRSDSNAVAWSNPLQISLENANEVSFVQGSRPVVDGDGHLYVVYHLIGQSFADYYRIRRSNDQGASFAFPVTAESLYTNFNTGPPGFNREFNVDFPGIAVDRSFGPHRGRLYLSWAESINWLDEVFALGLVGSKTEVEGNDTPATATPVTLGQTVRGTLASTGDLDYFSFTLQQGHHVVIAADSIQLSAPNSFALRLFAGDGVTRLAFTTFDSGVNPTTQQPGGFPVGWEFTAPVTGTYFFRLTGATGPAPYRLRTGEVHRTVERGRDQGDVFVGYSDDGSSWSDPVRLSEDAAGFNAFVPEVSVAPDGGVYAGWFDYRDAAATKDGGEASVYLSRSGDGGLTWTTLGAVTDSLSDWGAAGFNLKPNQGDYMAMFTSTSYVWTIWSDARRHDPDVFLARTPLIPNGAQVRFLAARLATQSVSIDWDASPADTLTMRLYRAQDGGPFQYLDVVQFSAAGTLTYTDTTVLNDHAYSYRLGRFTNGVELFYGQVSVFVSSNLQLSIGPPAVDLVVRDLSSFPIQLTLATNEPAEIVVFDLSGRAVFRRSVNLGRGPHTLAFNLNSGLKSGVYMFTVRQGGHINSKRVHIVR